MAETLPKIADSLKRSVQGGISTVESKFSVPYLFQIIHEAKSAVIRADFIQTRRIQAVWALPYEPEFDPNIQDEAGIVKFYLPSPPIALDNKNDGFLYVGDPNGLCNFRKVTSQAELANSNKHRTTEVKNIALGGKIKYLLVDNILKFYGNPNLKNILINYIPYNPTLLPTYNLEVDLYPIDGDNLAKMKTLILQSVTGIEAKVQADKIQDMSDSEGRQRTQTA